MTTRTRVVTVGLLATSLLVGCSDDGADDDGPDDAGGYSVAGALGQLPAPSGEGFTLVRTADLAGAAEAGDLPAPADDARGWLVGLSTAPLYVPLPPSVAQFALPVDEPGPTGFAFGDATAYASMEDRAAEELRQIEVYRIADGVEAEEGSDSGLLARVDGDLAAVARDDAVLDDWEGDGSAADDEGLALVADALDDHDVLAAVLSDNPAAEGVGTVGIGFAVEDDVPVEYVVYVLDDAEERADEVAALWEAEEAVDEVDAEAGDGVLVVRVTQADPEGPSAVAYALLEQGGAPFDL